MSMSDDGLELGDDAAWVAVALVLIASFGGAVFLAEWPLFGVPTEEPDEPHLVEPSEGETQLWPYTSRERGYEGRTLGINMVFYGDPDDVHTAFTERSALNWTDEQVHEGGADSNTVSYERIEVDPEADELGDVISWDEARGSVRYTYFETDDGGLWVDESYQLHVGNYLGERRHIRAYEDPNGEWTAVQVHEEHWDWFRLRHSVTGISNSQRELEREFMDDRAVETVVRMPFENETADSDGWVSGIYLFGAALPFMLLGFAETSRFPSRKFRRLFARHRHELALGFGLFGLYTAIRWLGIAGEQFLSGSPKIVAAPLYLALVFGLPSLAYVLGTDGDRTWAFTLATLGLGAAILVDFAAMGVSVLPLRIVLHRGAVLLAIGLIALGSAIRADRPEHTAPLTLGIASWILIVLAPLFGYI